MIHPHPLFQLQFIPHFYQQEGSKLLRKMQREERVATTLINTVCICNILQKKMKTNLAQMLIKIRRDFLSFLTYFHFSISITLPIYKRCWFMANNSTKAKFDWFFLLTIISFSSARLLELNWKLPSKIRKSKFHSSFKSSFTFSTSPPSKFLEINFRHYDL